MFADTHSGRTDKYAGKVQPLQSEIEDSDKFFGEFYKRVGQPLPKQTAKQVKKFKVSIEIQYTDSKTIKSQLESYIKRELRSLGDVEIVDREKAKYEIVLVAIPHVYEATGKKTGYMSLTVMILSEAPYELRIAIGIAEYLDRYHKDIKIDFMKALKPVDELIADELIPNSRLYYNPTLQIFLLEENNLHQKCKEIVAEFDADNLEPFRKIWK